MNDTVSNTAGLSVSIVSYFHDLSTLAATLDSLSAAISSLATTMPLRASVVVVDNSEDGSDASRLRSWLQSRDQTPSDKTFDVSLHVTGANGGYGAGNNIGQVITENSMADIPVQQRWVLILNPDVVLEETALVAGIGTLQANPGYSMLSPRALGEEGQDLYLAHRYPSWRVLGLRAAAPGIVSSGKPGWACTLMKHYECQDLPQGNAHSETVCASGCFMLMPFASWQQSGGFDENFFLYFEDYDLSCRLLTIGPVIYEPAVRIRHAGGQAAGKSGRHRQWFTASALRFFWVNGWPYRRHRIAATRRLPAGVRPS